MKKDFVDIEAEVKLLRKREVVLIGILGVILISIVGVFGYRYFKQFPEDHWIEGRNAVVQQYTALSDLQNKIDNHSEESLFGQKDEKFELAGLSFTLNMQQVSNDMWWDAISLGSNQYIVNFMVPDLARGQREVATLYINNEPVVEHTRTHTSVIFEQGSSKVLLHDIDQDMGLIVEVSVAK